MWSWYLTAMGLFPKLQTDEKQKGRQETCRPF